MVFASASGSSGKPKPKPQQWSSELPTYLTVYVSKPVSQTVEPPIPNDIVAFVPPAPTISTSPPRPSRPAGPGVGPPQPVPSEPPADAERQARPDERRGNNRSAQNQAQSKPDYSPDVEEESETAAFNAKEVRSYEDIFLSMDAVDLSYYSSLQEYDLVREAAISLRHEKFILHYLDNPREFLKHFATYTWDEEADGAAEEFIQWYVERFRQELERQLDILTSGSAFGAVEETIEDLIVGDLEDAINNPTFGEAEDTITRWHKDLTNDEREVVIAIDLITGETLFVRHGDEDSVTLHDEQKELVEDRYVALLHHHPKNSAASLADLDATKWMKAEFLLVTNPDGTLHRYTRVGDTLIPLEPTRNPEYAAPVDPLETALADAAYLIQTLSELGDPPEMVMRQGEAAPKPLDYIDHDWSKRTDEPNTDTDYARHNPLLSLVPRANFHTFLPVAFFYSKVYQAAQIAGSNGFDMAGTLLAHFLEGSGEEVNLLPVDYMIAELPLFREDIVDLIGYSLAENFPPNGDPESTIDRHKVHESDTHAVYSYAENWREVGTGKNGESTVYDFDDNTLDLDPARLIKLLHGQPPSEDIPQEQYDWYLAVGNFSYYPRVTVVVDKNTGNAEVGLKIEVRDQYNWHAEAGALDRLMASLETIGFGQNFAVSGESSPILGRFNLGDRISLEDSAGKTRNYYRLKDVDWNRDE